MGKTGPWRELYDPEERCLNPRLLGLWMQGEGILGRMFVWKCFLGSGRVRGMDLVLTEGKAGVEAKAGQGPQGTGLSQRQVQGGGQCGGQMVTNKG